MDDLLEKFDTASLSSVMSETSVYTMHEYQPSVPRIYASF